MWIVICLILGVFAFFGILQWFSDRNYRPTPEEITAILQDSIDGKLGWGALDEFSCVRIAYNERLNDIRTRFNEILDETGNCDWDKATEENQTPLTESGKKKMRQLIAELKNVAT